ncbi:MULTISPECIES: type II toxin-antitoxin system VapC family toxin [unclassified Adlercreutzia]|uniref:type II toxin-antitoxin system tRNA(fMet)-specific endonuclease VapC n=1 Tax=unclassified Adlercreutzia TaxID=2636013 RepID=UPI0013ED4FC3|nr:MULTISPECIES: type II toxin-antitoxin system VapC family toxin [unclassified Adlercreutzia]
MYMLDTNICVDFLRGRLPYALKMLRESDPQLFKIPSMVEAELRLGAYKSANPAKNRRAVEQFLSAFDVVSFCSLCAGAYARIRADLEKKGQIIGPNDLVIAATALAHDAVLVTNNCREFMRVEGLQIEAWEEVSF